MRKSESDDDDQIRKKLPRMLTTVRNAVPDVPGTLSFEVNRDDAGYKLIVNKRKAIKVWHDSMKPLTEFLRTECFSFVSRFDAPFDGIGIADRTEYRWYPVCPGHQTDHSCASGGDAHVPGQRGARHR